MEYTTDIYDANKKNTNLLDDDNSKDKITVEHDYVASMSTVYIKKPNGEVWKMVGEFKKIRDKYRNRTDV